MIYKSFSMRLSQRHDEADQESTWTVVLGRNGLEHILIGTLDNPMPNPKTSYEDVPGRNGENDLTEAAGRVFFDRKTITVTLQAEAWFQWMDEVEDIFRPYQGRVVDFAFEEPGRVEWFHTGRLSFASNRFRNRLFLTFDTEPLMTNVALTTLQIPVSPKEDVTGFDWDYDLSIHGNAVGGADYCYGEHIVVFADSPGTIIEFSRQEQSGTRYVMGIVDKVGGDVYFHNTDEDAGEITDNAIMGIADGHDTMCLRVFVDGSHYDWVTVNGTDYYYPCCRIAYHIASVGEDLDDDQHHVFPTNVLVEPDVSVTGNAVHLLVDGKAVSPLYKNGTIEDSQGAVLPGFRADFSGESIDSVIAAVRHAGSTADADTSVLVSFHEKRVG